MGTFAEVRDSLRKKQMQLKSDFTTPKKFVVYTCKKGKTERGIYQRYVAIARNRAFVWRDRDAQTADILPRENVFNTYEDAARYMAELKEGGGVERWVTFLDRNDVPELFKARVIYHAVEEQWGRRGWSWSMSIIRIDNNEVIGVHMRNRYGYEVHKTRKEAEKFYRDAWNSRKSELAHLLGELSEQEKKLLAGKPRSGKKGVI